MRVTKQYKPAEIREVVQGATIQNVEMIPDLTFNELDLLPGLSILNLKVKLKPVKLLWLPQSDRVLHPDYPNTISGVINEVTIVNGVILPIRTGPNAASICPPEQPLKMQ